MTSSVNSKTCEMSEPDASLLAFLSLTWALPGQAGMQQGCVRWFNGHSQS